jgi:hypothetical protein
MRPLRPERLKHAYSLQLPCRTHVEIRAIAPALALQNAYICAPLALCCSTKVSTYRTFSSLCCFRKGPKGRLLQTGSAGYTGSGLLSFRKQESYGHQNLVGINLAILE